MKKKRKISDKILTFPLKERRRTSLTQKKQKKGIIKDYSGKK